MLDKVSEDKLVLTYLADDSDCRSPLESCDGEGGIFTSHRHAGQDSHRSMQQALGLDSDWNEDLYHSEALKLTSELIINQLKSDKNLRARLTRLMNKYSTKAINSLNSLILQACEDMNDGVYVTDTFVRYFCNQYYLHNMEGREHETLSELGAIAESKLNDGFNLARSRGLIGNNLAIKLDIYEHGGISYSVSGEGMQCRFDTSRGAAVWVPDDCARENIDTKAAKLLGMPIIVEETCCIGMKPEHNRPWKLTVNGKSFSNWSAATQAVLGLFDATTVLKARREVAFDYCRSVLDTYNDWSNGNCYGIVSITYEKQADGEWVESDEQSCWGYIGHQATVDEATSQHQYLIK